MKHTYREKVHVLITFLILLGLVVVLYLSLSPVLQNGELLKFIWFLPQTALLIMCFYVFFPTLIFWVFKRKIEAQYTSKPSKKETNFKHFLLLIPAHNESMSLPHLLKSIAHLDYPSAYFQTILIADNCTDDTAMIGQAHGINVFRRKSEGKSDKTQALKYAAEKLPVFYPEQNSYVVILDADGVVSPDFLKALNHTIRQTQLTVYQCYRKVQNKDDSKVSFLDAASEELRQKVFSGTRAFWGLENYLYGLGSIFEKDLFIALTDLDQLVFADDKAWKAHLSEQAIKVGYAPLAKLEYMVCSSSDDFQQQRLRWVTGHYDMIKRFFLPVLKNGVKRMDLSQIDFAFSIITLPRSFLMLFSIFYFIFSFFFPNWSLVSWGFWLGIVLLFPILGALGFYLIKAPLKNYLYLLKGADVVMGVAKSNYLSLVKKGTIFWAVNRKQHSTKPMDSEEK